MFCAGHRLLTQARCRRLHAYDHATLIVDQIVVVVTEASWRATLGLLAILSDKTFTANPRMFFFFPCHVVDAGRNHFLGFPVDLIAEMPFKPTNAL